MLPSGDADEVRKFFRLVVATAGFTFGVMVLGSLVRAMDAGLACPDWPLCFQKVIPIFDTRIFLEWFHRVVAGGLGVLLLVVVVKVFRRPALRRLFGPQMAVAAGLLLVQVILGGLTVLKLLNPGIVSLHLINALIFASLLLWTAVKAWFAYRPEPDASVSKNLRTSLLGLSVLLLVQIAVGGMVSTNHAGLACPDFPTCHGSWWPDASFLMWLQMSHRYLAFTVFAVIVFLAVLSATSTPPRLVRHVCRLLPTLVVVQIALGIANVYLFLPVWASVIHLANALLMYALAFTGAVYTLYVKSGGQGQASVPAQRKLQAFAHHS